jgi:hypothetical protein
MPRPAGRQSVPDGVSERRHAERYHGDHEREVARPAGTSKLDDTQPSCAPSGQRDNPAPLHADLVMLARFGLTEQSVRTSLVRNSGVPSGNIAARSRTSQTPPSMA